MGGPGSGEWSRGVKTRTLEDLRSLDIRLLRRRGLLQPGRSTWESKRDSIDLDWTPAPYGGQRPWFLCPACTRRVALLYWFGQGVVCRHCTRLPYASQGETPFDRSIRKVRKIRARLGVSYDLRQPIYLWDAPRGMHMHTFERLRVQEAYARLAVGHHQHAWSTRFMEQHEEALTEEARRVLAVLDQARGA